VDKIDESKIEEKLKNQGANVSTYIKDKYGKIQVIFKL